MCIIQHLYARGKFKVAATSLKHEMRLHTDLVGTECTDVVPKATVTSPPDWLMHSELGYFARSLTSGLNYGAATKLSWIYALFQNHMHPNYDFIMFICTCQVILHAYNQLQYKLPVVIMCFEREFHSLRKFFE